MAVVCKAITAKGVECKCKAKTGFDYCGRHKGCFECTICYCHKNVRERHETKCGHVFCKTCINKWTEKNDTCPICRCKIVESLIDRLYNKYKHPTSIQELMNSIRELITICSEFESTQDKMSIFDLMCKLLITDIGSCFIKKNPQFHSILKSKFEELAHAFGNRYENINNAILLYNIV